MKNFIPRIKWNRRRWVLLSLLFWLPVCCFCLTYLAQQRREERERALYDGLSIHEWMDRTLREPYWSAYWATGREPETTRLIDGKMIGIGAPAVPEMVVRLRGLHMGWLHDKLIYWRVTRFPSWASYPNYLEIPDDVSGDAAHINYLLSKMGEAARPAVPAMLDSAGDLYAWAYYDLLADLVRLGPVGRDALPRLKTWAKAGDINTATAIKFIERGMTNATYYDLEENNSSPP
jgi:hypothetical protein